MSRRALGGPGKATGSTRINRYERDVNSLSLDTLALLAKALDVPRAFLLADSEEMAQKTLASAG